MFKKILLVARSSNTKTGNIPVTYLGRETCPSSCPFLLNGCYGDGRIFALAHKLARALSLSEARAILAKRDKSAKYLRDRVVGDLVTATGKFNIRHVRDIARLAREHALVPFGYTHAWRTMTRQDVTDVKAAGYVLNASCETLDDVRQAIEIGMPTVITNDDVREGSIVDGMRVITCPAQTRDNVSCATCGLCAKPDRKVVIRFLVHGPSKVRARSAVKTRQLA